MGQTRVEVRLAVEHIERGAGDRAILQGVDQRLLIDHSAARDVDDDALGAKCFQDLVGDHTPRLIRHRAGQHQNVAC
jgi:hypothetical protein